MRWIALLISCAALAGCEPVRQPESAKTVAAYEIALQSADDRYELLSILKTVSAPYGMHVDVASERELATIALGSRMTIHAAVWRGENDDESIASIWDRPEHLGQPWIAFARGEDPELVGRFRDHAMREIKARWPETLSLPIMPTGAIPHKRDLIRTPNGYIVDPAAAAKYEVRPRP